LSHDIRLRLDHSTGKRTLAAGFAGQEPGLLDVVVYIDDAGSNFQKILRISDFSFSSSVLSPFSRHISTKKKPLITFS